MAFLLLAAPALALLLSSNNKAENVAGIITKDIQNIIQESVLKCKNEGITNNIKVSSIGCDVTFITNIDISQNIVYTGKCINDTNFSNDIKTKLDNYVKQAAETLKKGLNIGPSTNTSTNINSILNDLAVNISQKTFTECAMKTNNNNEIIVDCTKNPNGQFIMDNVKLSQGQDVTFTCISNNSSTNKILQQLKTVVDQNATATTIGFSFIWIIIIVVIIIVIIIIVLIISIFT